MGFTGRRIGLSIVFILFLGLTALVADRFFLHQRYSRLAENYVIAYGLGQPVKVTQTPGCDTNPIAQPVPVLEVLYKLVINGSVKTVILSPDVCYRLGDTSINTYYRQARGVIGVFHTETAAKVESIELYPQSRLPKSVYLDADVEMPFHVPFDDPEASPDSLVAVVKIHVDHPAKRHTSRELPTEYTGFTTVDVSGLEALLNQGAVLIDVRSAESFAKGHHSKAISMPYQESAPGERSRHLRFEYYGRDDLFALSEVHAAKDQLVVVTGENKLDYLAVRAATALWIHGWKKVSWFRGGEAERTGISLDVPVEPYAAKGVSEIHAEEVAKMLTSKFPIVDVRPRENFEKRSINGAISVPCSVVNSLAMQNITDPGHQTDPVFSKFPTDKNQPIAVMGIDEFDDCAPKFGLVLKTMGWKSVSWYRGGFRDWVDSSELAPTDFTFRH